MENTVERFNSKIYINIYNIKKEIEEVTKKIDLNKKRNLKINNELNEIKESLFKFIIALDQVSDYILNKNYLLLSDINLNKMLLDICNLLNRLSLTKTFVKKNGFYEDIFSIFLKCEILVESFELYFIFLYNSFEFHLKNKFMKVCLKYDFIDDIIVNKDSFINIKRFKEILKGTEEMEDFKNEMFHSIFGDLTNLKVIKYIEEYTPLCLHINGDDITSYVLEFNARRNIITHNNSIVDYNYIDFLKKNKGYIYGFEIDHTIYITGDYYFKFLYIVRQLFINLDNYKE